LTPNGVKRSTTDSNKTTKKTVNNQASGENK